MMLNRDADWSLIESGLRGDLQSGRFPRAAFDLGVGRSDNFGKLCARTGIEPRAIVAPGSRSLEQDWRFLPHERMEIRCRAVRPQRRRQAAHGPVVWRDWKRSGGHGRLGRFKSQLRLERHFESGAYINYRARVSVAADGKTSVLKLTASYEAKGASDDWGLIGRTCWSSN
jgi:hypothetical protein